MVSSPRETQYFDASPARAALADALRRAAAAHATNDGNWDWYAAYIAAEQAGTELPK